MIKTVEAGSWSGPGMDQPVQMVRIPRGGLHGNDLRTFMKTAAHSFAKDLLEWRPQPDEVPIHIIAIGATEPYGCNRNGDGFSEKTCQDQHHTFVKGARWYRNHQNKDPEKSYGCVKASTYNDRMKRIELLVVGNMNEKAAARNGGLAMSRESLDKLANGELLPVSMACKIAFDVCSNCGHQAATRADYCTKESCINPDTGYQGFGCRHGLTKTADDGFQQFVENPGANFFDISEVWRPADRTAYGGTADYLTKAAADHVPGGAELAERWVQAGAGFSLLPEGSAARHRLVEKCAVCLQHLVQAEKSTYVGCRPLPRAIAEKLGAIAAQHKTADARARLLSACLALDVILPPEAFVPLVAREKAAVLLPQVQAALPGLFGKLAELPDLSSVLDKYASDWVDVWPGITQRHAAFQMAHGCRYAPHWLFHQLTKMALQPLEKRAAVEVSPDAAELAVQYAAYGLQAMASIPGPAQRAAGTWLTMAHMSPAVPAD